MLDEIQSDAKHRMDQAVEHTRMELVKIRTGRANPEVLNSVTVDYYGTKTPLNQISNITVPEARLITIQPFEKHLIPEIEKAIMDSNIGLTPNNNGTAILLPVPALSEERRKDLIRMVHQQVEEGRVAVRNVRRDAIHHVRDYGKEEHISEDEIRMVEQDMQEMTDKHVESLNTLQEHKEKELMEF
ncbi:MAG: ribosome recycling factor [Candidatus Marinimicrobia bacterium]|jgi:ribosome recycling factor|nr:ribosome recycling factor [Candidatus Neomarinimicrobiota bacterium]|tara:strand:+ start:215 stop:772 length:558 start_codon:yes stop_codon:yes gene_type:complete